MEHAKVIHSHHFYSTYHHFYDSVQWFLYNSFAPILHKPLFPHNCIKGWGINKSEWNSVRRAVTNCGTNTSLTDSSTSIFYLSFKALPMPLPSWSPSTLRKPTTLFVFFFLKINFSYKFGVDMYILLMFSLF